VAGLDDVDLFSKLTLCKDDVTRAVAAQVEYESKIEAHLKAVYHILVQVINSGRFQRGIDRVNLHRPTARMVSGSSML
jgi:hypothetical protein